MNLNWRALTPFLVAAFLVGFLATGDGPYYMW